MKKITVITFLCLAVGLSAFSFPFNIENGMAQKASNTLMKKFSEAKEISWSNTQTYLKATFKLNDKVMFAYFNASGEFTGLSRNMLSSELPLNLQMQLKVVYSGGWITELFEFAGPDSTEYYATIENVDQKFMLVSSGSTSWFVYRKIRK